MRQIGARREPKLAEAAAGELLVTAGRFNEAIAHLAPTTFVPKGVYCFKSHEADHRNALDCLTIGMGLLAAHRAST